MRWNLPNLVPPARLQYALVAVIAVLVMWRIAYHAAYVGLSPFAYVTVSDGQVYEDGARDIVAHPPLGTQSFFLQGIYTYVLALGLSLRGVLLDALFLQLALAALAMLAFWRAAVMWFGKQAGTVSLAVLLVCPAVAYYENKYLSTSFGVCCNALVLLAFARFARAPSGAAAMLLGAASGLAVLARPNLVAALPFTMFAMALCARHRAAAWRPLLVQFALAAVLALVPLAARNVIVVGRPDLFSSHRGGIPFYIGNGPHADGLWNTAGGLTSGQVALERRELAGKLGVSASDGSLDEAIGDELYARAFAFIRAEPLRWLEITAKKLRYSVSNREFVHDFDPLGERELLGFAAPSVPFGVILALGVLGLQRLARRRTDEEAALLWMLGGQLLATLLANVVWFSSSQHRMPLALPLAFCAGPVLHELFTETSRPPLMASAVALALGAQAFIHGPLPTRPSSVHYFNLANAEEVLARYPQALEHYRVAAERGGKRPMFLLRYAYLARRMHRDAEARAALERLLQRSDLPREVEAAARNELGILKARAQ